MLGQASKLMLCQHFCQHFSKLLTRSFHRNQLTVAGIPSLNDGHGFKTRVKQSGKGDGQQRTVTSVQDLKRDDVAMNLNPVNASFSVSYKKIIEKMLFTEMSISFSTINIWKSAKTRLTRNAIFMKTVDLQIGNLGQLLRHRLLLSRNGLRLGCSVSVISLPVINSPREVQNQCSFHTWSRHRASEQPLNHLNSSVDGTQSEGQKGNDHAREKPEIGQLLEAKGKLEDLITKMFTNRHDYGVLHKNVIFENNLFGANRTCLGVSAYAVELMKLRFQVHLRFPSAVVEVREVTILDESGVIKIHWRLKGLSQKQVLKVWRLFQRRDVVESDEWEWLDAFSYFHIGKDGLVHKHRIDRMVADTEGESGKLKDLADAPKPAMS